MKKYIAVGIFAIAIISLTIGVNSINGVFSKAFTKSLSPGEIYERNITVRKYYDLTVRFQKENSTSYLGFDNNETVVVLKDDTGNEIASNTGASNGRVSFFTEKSQLDQISRVSAYNLGTYMDIENQVVNITYSGTSAYITLKVSYMPASIRGYILDDLTGQVVDGVNVLAIPGDSDPVETVPLVQNTSLVDGSYLLTLQLNSSKSLDVYVEGYSVAS